ncbi:serine protease inhibitor Kazal-type 1-like [Eublepharis macularius]|uniref:Serine protease inhibitor Kazal-type 1-like n=1 Tax=Eublepharis macularius TaxID=481883 RepID=A0AA97JCG1_EUBMA|nr:serine protease inhibitor Kazal-type 1-like [Eublepharis macularius]
MSFKDKLNVSVLSGVFSQPERPSELDCKNFQNPTGIGRPEITQCPDFEYTVCGTDNNTYANECLICQYNADHNPEPKVGRKHDGPCTDN